MPCCLSQRSSSFDEPNGRLDPHAIKELKPDFFLSSEIRVFLLLISTHMIDSVEDYWDVAHIMMDGEIRATRRPEELTETDESLEALFFSITEGEA